MDYYEIHSLDLLSRHCIFKCGTLYRVEQEIKIYSDIHFQNYKDDYLTLKTFEWKQYMYLRLYYITLSAQDKLRIACCQGYVYLFYFLILN